MWLNPAMLDTRIFQDVEVSDAWQDRELFLVSLLVAYITHRDIILSWKYLLIICLEFFQTIFISASSKGEKEGI